MFGQLGGEVKVDSRFIGYAAWGCEVLYRGARRVELHLPVLATLTTANFADTSEVDHVVAVDPKKAVGPATPKRRFVSFAGKLTLGFLGMVILKAHGGKLSLQAQPEGGLIVTCWLPPARSERTG